MADFMQDWIDFKNEILYKNRYFCNHKMIENIRQLAEKQCKILPEETLLYRARIIKREQVHEDAKIILGDKMDNDDVAIRVKLLDDLGIHGFNEENSGMPPTEKTVDGRVNPKYIPYFYLAMHPYTAVAECKPYQFDNVSVASYLVSCPIKIMYAGGFVNKPFGETSYEEALLNRLNYEFGHPVKENSKDYIITQYISEFIKHLGFDGISYMSSLHKKGENVALFSKDKTRFLGSFVYEVNDTVLKIKPAIINYDAPDITPDEHRASVTSGRVNPK